MESVLARSPKVMIDIPDGNNLMFLPLDQLMSGGRSNADSLQGLSGSNTDTQSLIDEFNNNANRSRSRETRQ
jgi:membrane protease subunit HflK